MLPAMSSETYMKLVCPGLMIPSNEKGLILQGSGKQEEIIEEITIGPQTGLRKGKARTNFGGELWHL